MFTVEIIKSAFPLLDNIACREMEHSKRSKCTYSSLNSLSLTSSEKVAPYWIAEPDKKYGSPPISRRPLKFPELFQNAQSQLKRSLCVLLPRGELINQQQTVLVVERGGLWGLPLRRARVWHGTEGQHGWGAQLSGAFLVPVPRGGCSFNRSFSQGDRSYSRLLDIIKCHYHNSVVC